MENINAGKIQEILEIYESLLNFEIKDLKTKVNNIKRVNVKLLTDQILEEKGSNCNTEDILYRIRQIILD